MSVAGLYWAGRARRFCFLPLASRGVLAASASATLLFHSHCYTLDEPVLVLTEVMKTAFSWCGRASVLLAMFFFLFLFW
jgi:hypothetical protein